MPGYLERRCLHRIKSKLLFEPHHINRTVLYLRLYSDSGIESRNHESSKLKNPDFIFPNHHNLSSNCASKLDAGSSSTGPEASTQDSIITSPWRPGDAYITLKGEGSDSSRRELASSVNKDKSCDIIKTIKLSNSLTGPHDSLRPAELLPNDKTNTSTTPNDDIKNHSQDPSSLAS